jgi:hypothetical protein
VNICTSNLLEGHNLRQMILNGYSLPALPRADPGYADHQIIEPGFLKIIFERSMMLWDYIYRLYVDYCPHVSVGYI